jgi:hypothetical protein
MILFDRFKDALEEAEWCAKTEKRIYIILWRGDKFKVMPKYRMRRNCSHIELGYKND